MPTHYFQQAASIQEDLLNDAVQVQVKIKSENIVKVLKDLIECVRQQGQYIDNLQRNYATKADLRNAATDIETKLTEKMKGDRDKMQETMDEVTKTTSTLSKKVEKLEKTVEDNYAEVNERFADLQRDNDDKFREVYEKTQDLTHRFDKMDSRVDDESEKLDNLYELFELDRGDTKELLNNTSVTSDKKLEHLKETPIFTAVWDEIAVMDTKKTDNTRTDELDTIVQQTKAKMQQMKDNIKKLIQKKVETAARKEVQTFIDPFKQNMEEQMENKANEEDMLNRLARKADVVDMRKKSDHENMLRLFDNVKRQLEESLNEMSNWGNEIQADLEQKAYRHELNSISTKVTSMESTDETTASASARYRCLCCGAAEPKDREYTQSNEAYLFPRGQTVGKTGRWKSPTRNMQSVTVNNRPPSRQITGRDGHPYLTDEKINSRKITITETNTNTTASSPLNRASPQRGRLRPHKKKEVDTDAIHLDDYLQTADKPNVKLPSPTLKPGLENDPNL